jgi:hypothetical protein
MALERELEMLDDYVANRLSDADRSVMEAKIASDTELKRELSIQQQVIEGLRRARIAQLKQMLQNTPIPPPTGGQALLVKLGTAVVTAGIIGTGLYFFLKDDKGSVAQESAAPTQQEPVATDSQAQQPATGPAIDSQASEPRPEMKTPAQTTDKKNKTKVDTSARTAREPQKPAAFDPTSEETSTSATPSGDAPVISGSAKNANASSIAIENVVDKKYNFHYQFKDGKLLLYGPFSERTTYEILEFFDGNKGNTVILYYKDGYYLLHEDADKVTPLKPITDPVLLGKLKEYRKN